MKMTFTQSICTRDNVYNGTLEMLSLVKTCNVNHTTWTIWTRSKTLIKYYRLTEIPYIFSKSQKHPHAVDYLNFCLYLGDTVFFLYLAREPGHAVIIWHLDRTSPAPLRSVDERHPLPGNSISNGRTNPPTDLLKKNVGCPFPIGSFLFL